MRNNNDSGVVLIVVIWIIAILSALAIGMSRRVSVELAMVRYAVHSLQARALAWAGLQDALARISEDTQDAESGKFDDLWQCGITLGEEETPEKIFKNVALGNGAYEIGHWLGTGDSKKVFVYGLIDEQSKVNLNAINEQNRKVLEELLTTLGVDAKTSEKIATSVIEWRLAPVETGPAASRDIAAQSFQVKRAPFDHLEEFLLLENVTPDIFEVSRDFLTVFPKNPSRLEINANTAPPEVLRALARSLAGGVTNTSALVADSLADKMVKFRRGNDGMDATMDDEPLDFEKISLTADERAILQTMAQSMSVIAQILRVAGAGIERTSGVRFNFQAVVQRSDLAILAWEAR